MQRARPFSNDFIYPKYVKNVLNSFSSSKTWFIIKKNNIRHYAERISVISVHHVYVSARGIMTNVRFVTTPNRKMSENHENKHSSKK